MVNPLLDGALYAALELLLLPPKPPGPRRRSTPGGIPLAIKVMGAHRHGCTAFTSMVQAIPPTQGRYGQPRRPRNEGRIPRIKGSTSCPC
jgi:hypothetical protein